MKRSITIILAILLAVPFSHGQLWKMRRWEIEAGVGPSLFFGDIGGFSRDKNLLGLRDLSYLQTRFDINASMRYRFARQFNARLNFSGGLLHATDQRGSNEGRELEALTTFFEGDLIAEYYFIKNKAERSYLFLRGRARRPLVTLLTSLDFYAFTGIGGIFYSVKPNERLETFGYETGGFTAVIPGGIGTTLIYNPNLNFGIELGGRYTFTDFLDGYTHPQFSEANDVYYFLNFIVTYKLKSGPRGLPRFRR
ncbi:MAG: hypothetical protein IQL11_04795 [Bacteroidales bacterium]|nr:hypothetical protein [Bacteroidales bacterium]